MEQNQQAPEAEEMDLEGAFNLLVSLARNTKLNYQEHALVDNAIKMVHEALNTKEEELKEE